jgi:DNA-nicking Smr family endonuclease
MFSNRSSDVKVGAEKVEESGPVEIPVDGVLDLHTFDPRDVEDLLPHYLSVCREKGILQVRVIHGKGTGVLRERIRSILARLPEVNSFRTAGEDSGGWGATMVILKPGRKKP